MPAKDSKTILVRVPAEIVDAAIKLKKQENLPTIGNAIRYWFEQQKDDQIQSRLINLEELMNQILSGTLTLTRRVNKFQPTVCAAFRGLLGENHKLAKQIREATNCKGCQVGLKSQK